MEIKRLIRITQIIQEESKGIFSLLFGVDFQLPIEKRSVTPYTLTDLKKNFTVVLRTSWCIIYKLIRHIRRCCLFLPQYSLSLVTDKAILKYIYLFAVQHCYLVNPSYPNIFFYSFPLETQFSSF